MAWAMGVEDLDELNQRLAKLIDLKLPKGMGPMMNRGMEVFEALRRVGLGPSKTTKAPVQEVVITDKPDVPHLAVWSRRDGLIAPRAARGLEHERDEEAELNCTHMAFGMSKRAAENVVREIDRFLKRHT